MGQKTLGMTSGQWIVLVVLGMAACILIGIAGVMLLRVRAGAVQVVAPTGTPAPSRTPLPTPTAVSTVTPIPGWTAYTFAQGQASLWLPAGYNGGDPSTATETIMANLRSATQDQAFLDDVRDLIALPDIKFFAFDPDFDTGIRIVYVGAEAMDPGADVNMDEALNQLMSNFTGASDRVVERQVVQLERFPAGKLVVDSKVPAGDGEALTSLAVYAVQSGEWMWYLSFRTGREEFKGYQPTIEASVNSFWAHP